MKKLTAVVSMIEFVMISPAFADFLESFDGVGYVAGAAVPPPWVVAAHQAPPPDNSMIVSASPSGFGGTQGAHGPGPVWFESDRPSLFDAGFASHILQWKAKVDSANASGRLNVGLGNATGGQIIWEMRNTSSAGGVIEFPTVGSNEVGGGGFTTVPFVSETWYQMTVTVTNVAGSWSWTGVYASSPDGITFNPAVAMGSGTLPVGWAPETVGLQSLFAFNEPGGTSALDDITFSAVPEPTSLALLGIGACLLYRVRRGRALR